MVVAYVGDVEDCLEENWIVMKKMASLFSMRICHARKFLYRWSNDSSKNELYIAEPPAEQKGVGRVDRKYCSCI